MDEIYRRQVELLLNVLPEVAKEHCFAMHGGTAINLFIREMPRLSIDIDLTYTELGDRQAALNGINAALSRIKARIQTMRPNIKVQHKDQVCKLQIDDGDVVIKIEVNMVGRGLLDDPLQMPLCQVAQDHFGVFCMMPLVPLSQLYGGKFCAALDRQHPRDLFDVKLLFENEGFTDEIRRGFIYGLASSNRPTHEMLAPHLLDQRVAFENQFVGMTSVSFTYDEYQSVRHHLIDTVKAGLREEDRIFLLSLNRLTPDWSVHDWQRFPSVQWKLLNLAKFKRNRPSDYEEQLIRLENILTS